MTLRHFDVAVNRFVTKMSYSRDFGALPKKTEKTGLCEDIQYFKEGEEVEDVFAS